MSQLVAVEASAGLGEAATGSSEVTKANPGDHGIERVKDVRIPRQAEEGLRMSGLRSSIDKTVDNLIEFLHKKHFVDAMPTGLNREYAVALQGKMCSVMRTKICQMVEDKLREDDIATKLNQLDQLIKTTPQSVRHRAWRPPVRDTVDSSVIAHDLLVSLNHKEKLEQLLRSAEQECDELKQQVLEAERRLSGNQTVLNNLEKNYESLTNKLLQNV